MFQKALPIWIPNQTHKEKLNTQLLFTAEVASLEGTVLHLTAADFYRVTVNGRFVGFGPARTAKGYARVDSYDLSAYDNQKLYADDTSVRGMIQRRRPNEIRVEVAGYHCSTLATALQDSFLAAELVDESGTPVLYTGGEYEGEGFYCFHHSRRARNVERYSVQRHFTEIWNEHVEDPKADFLRTEVEPIEGTITFLPRAVPMPRCEVLDITEFVSRGTCEAKEPTRLNSYSFPPAKEPDWGYFPEEKVEFKPFRYVNGQKLNQTEGVGQMPLTLQAGQWAVVDFKQLEVGFLRFAAEAEENAEVLLAFTEFIEQEPFSFTRMNAQNVIEYHIPKYKQLQAESFEPYSFRQVMILVKRGSIRLESVGYRTFERPMDAARELPISDPQLAGIYRAAKRTFAHNAVDIFMDCPSRERAGWLCDSFFTARAEHFFFGETLVEDAYLQNYLLYKNEGEFPELEEDPVDGLEEEVQVGQVEDDGPPLVHGEPAGDEEEDRHMEGVNEPIKALVPAAPLRGEGEQVAQHRQEDQDAFQIVKAVGPLLHGKGHGEGPPFGGMFSQYSTFGRGLQGTKSHLTGGMGYPIIIPPNFEGKR